MSLWTRGRGCLWLFIISWICLVFILETGVLESWNILFFFLFYFQDLRDTWHHLHGLASPWDWLLLFCKCRLHFLWLPGDCIFILSKYFVFSWSIRSLPLSHLLLILLTLVLLIGLILLSRLMHWRRLWGLMHRRGLSVLRLVLLSGNSKHLTNFFLIFRISQKFIQTFPQNINIQKIRLISFLFRLINRRILFVVIDFPVFFKFIDLRRTSKLSILLNWPFLGFRVPVTTIILTYSKLFFFAVIFSHTIIWFFTWDFRSFLSLKSWIETHPSTLKKFTIKIWSFLCLIWFAKCHFWGWVRRSSRVRYP